jgi:parvulin-like peptidyl-prolyl isomerase
MAKRRQQVQEERELTRKEVRLRARTRERNRRLFIGAGTAIGLALVIVIVGAVIQFVVRPNSAIATVGEERIITRDFWQRMRFERWQLQNQLAQMQQLQAQFGQNLFSAQISQLQSTLASNAALGIQVLDRMIDETVIRQQAAARGITVDEAEIDAALREEIANGRGAVTEPQATETAEAGVNATATAASWTPTPTPTLNVSAITTTAGTTATEGLTDTEVPTPAPPATAAIISETGYTEGLATLTENLSAAGGLTIEQYREIIRTRLLTEKLQVAVTEDQVQATEEQVHARHILIAIREPETPSDTITDTAEITTVTPLTSLGGISATDMVTGAEPVTATASVTATADITGASELTATDSAVTATEDIATATSVTSTDETTATANVTATTPVTGAAALTGTSAITNTAEVTATASPTSTVTPDPTAPRTDAEALALAQELRQRLLEGEDFSTLAAQYSDDPGSGANGGDLGWFGKGRMVAEFETAAFSLPLNEVSEPIKTQYGYHLIEVLERDTERPKPEAQLEQERQAAFQTWLNEQKTATYIERPNDLPSLLPPGLD